MTEFDKLKMPEMHNNIDIELSRMMFLFSIHEKLCRIDSAGSTLP